MKATFVRISRLSGILCLFMFARPGCGQSSNLEEKAAYVRIDYIAHCTQAIRFTSIQDKSKKTQGRVATYQAFSDGNGFLFISKIVVDLKTHLRTEWLKTEDSKELIKFSLQPSAGALIAIPDAAVIGDLEIGGHRVSFAPRDATVPTVQLYLQRAFKDSWSVGDRDALERMTDVINSCALLISQGTVLRALYPNSGHGSCECTVDQAAVDPARDLQFAALDPEFGSLLARTPTLPKMPGPAE